MCRAHVSIQANKQDEFFFPSLESNKAELQFDNFCCPETNITKGGVLGWSTPQISCSYDEATWILNFFCPRLKITVHWPKNYVPVLSHLGKKGLFIEPIYIPLFRFFSFHCHPTDAHHFRKSECNQVNHQCQTQSWNHTTYNFSPDLQVHRFLPLHSSYTQTWRWTLLYCSSFAKMPERQWGTSMFADPKTLDGSDRQRSTRKENWRSR